MKKIVITAASTIIMACLMVQLTFVCADAFFPEKIPALIKMIRVVYN